MILLVLLFAGISSAVAQNAEDAQARLKSIKDTLTQSLKRRDAFQKQAQQAEQEADTLAQRLVQLGRRLRGLDDEVERLETRLKDLNGFKKDLLERLASDRESLVLLIAALERLGRRPAVLSLFQPGSALETARSASLISGMVPMINAQALDVRLDIESLLRAEAGLVTERQNLATTVATLSSARADLDTLVKERKEARKAALASIKAESRQQDRLRREAKDLEALLAEIFSRQPLARPRRQAPTNSERGNAGGSSAVQGGGPSITLMAAADFRRLKGQLIPPVTGKRTLAFGQRDGVLKAQGERRAARPGSEVLSPSDGRVVFSAPFKDFGQVLIIEHAQGYHSLLAGLNDRYAELGQAVLAGEPIGAMGRFGVASPVERQVPALPELYLELREKGKSINPTPWYKK